MSPAITLLTRIDAVREPLSLSDLWSAEAYALARPRVVQQLLSLKQARRVRVGEHCTLVFESRASVWFQIHEELRHHAGDRLSFASDLLGRYACLGSVPGELRASLLLECGEPQLARELSRHLATHLESLSLFLPRGRFAARRLDPCAHGIAGVAFLRFVLEEAHESRRASLIQWTAPLYPVLSTLTPEVVQSVLSQL